MKEIHGYLKTNNDSTQQRISGSNDSNESPDREEYGDLTKAHQKAESLIPQVKLLEFQRFGNTNEWDYDGFDYDLRAP